MTLPTYREPAEEDFPIFAESRVHQRSSGNPYPQKVVCAVDRTSPAEKEYTAVRLENEYLRVILLPELGGRIFEAYDKANDYHFFYRQHVIKPALIGLLGSWISGGVEFNWPCHHRPSTFMPVDFTIENGSDGSVTVWMSENEPLDRMKGMVGVRLGAEEAAIDTLMRVYNRTPYRHSFLWWENAAVPVHEKYRIFFPHDVGYVQFHYRKNVTTYPLASGLYNGIRMGENSVDIRFHKNTRQPTSYFCGETKREFFGGYDEEKQAGVVHVANRHLSIGKKMFTWAYNQLSHSWEKALTDTDGAYAELMASSYSANQPDFAWLEPYETKTFAQRWYPIGAMGVPDIAQREAAARFAPEGVWLQATRPVSKGTLLCGGREYPVAVQPGRPVWIPCGGADKLEFRDEKGIVLLRDGLCAADSTLLPQPLPSLPTLDAPGDAQSVYLRGVHIDQYRDPAVKPDAYYREALRRDPRHIPSLIALSEYESRNGRYDSALSFAKRARAGATEWNFHPESGRLEYALAQALEGLGREEEAFDAYYRAYWNQDARSRAMARIAALDGRRGDWHAMLLHAGEALKTDAEQSFARAEKAVALRRLGRGEEAQVEIARALAADAEDGLALALQAVWQRQADWINTRRSDPAQQALDIALDLIDMGENAAAAELLGALKQPVAMTAYTRAYALGMDTEDGQAEMKKAQKLPFGHAYPVRLGEERVLRAAHRLAPGDTTAAFALGCLTYHRRNYQEAFELWKDVLDRDPKNTQALRCLGIVCYSHLGRREEGFAFLRRAWEMEPEQAHLTWEVGYVMNRLSLPAGETADFLRRAPACDRRDDLAVERARSLNLDGQWEEALRLMLSRAFVPCEGGEHAVAEQYMFAHHALGRKELAEGDCARALEHFRAAQVLPENLGAGLWNEVLLAPHRYAEGVCLKMLGREEEAEKCFRFVCDLPQDYFSDMHLPELPCWQALAHRQLGHDAKALELLARHEQKWRQAREARDPGFFKTTPFFISFLEDAPQMRAWACNYHCGLALSLLPGREEEGRVLLADSDPGNLYARLALRFPFGK